MTEKLRIGIVGCGTISDIHAEAIQQAKNARLISVFSRSEKNASRVGEKFKTKWSVEWNEFISDPNLDAVSICTPNGNHLDYGKRAAEAGKHVILEKPIEVTLKRAKELINACKQNNVQLAVIYQYRFYPEVEALKRQIDNNKIGSLFMGDAYIKWFRSQDYYDSGAWRGTFELDGGGVLINQAIHTIDLLQWLMGDVETVFGQVGTFTHERMEGEDNAVATLRFKSGAIGVIEGSTSVQPAQSRRIELHGEKGSAVIDDNNVKISVIGESQDKDETDKDNAVKSTGSSSPLGGFSIEPHKNQFEAIVNAINNSEPPPVSGEESIKSLAIVVAIYESSKTNAMVNLDDFIEKQ
ncbi:MAG: Gfo/Idh/MocA family oxidoreductase [Bacteroidota bacterium]|nr:Gfo/Idh/MocA family oxidoreductase [Bacteroidota bacterium]